VESTVYRRGSDGKVIGTPEVKPVTEIQSNQSLQSPLIELAKLANTQAQPKIVAEKPQPVSPNASSCNSQNQLKRKLHLQNQNLL
jgi:hypothetical protein